MLSNAANLSSVKYNPVSQRGGSILIGPGDVTWSFTHFQLIQADISELIINMIQTLE